MKVSVIIPSLYEQDGEFLKLCVKSLRATTDWDIIVVTNGGNKPILNIPGVTTHIHTRDQGQCNATNIGVQLVSPTTDYIFISNSDMYYAPNWNDNLDFKYPMFSPNLVEPVNNNGSAPPFHKCDGGWDLEEFDQELVDDFIKVMTKSREKDESGFNFPLFVRKDFWDFLGGYDIAYDPWGSNSDTDLQTRANLSGVTPMRVRDVLVYHFSNKTDTFKPENDGFRHQNFAYFLEKFGFDRDQLGSDVWFNKDMIPTDESLIKYRQEKYSG